MKNFLSKEKLIGLVDNYILVKNNYSNFKLESINPKNLLSYNRLDISFKLLFLYLKDKNINLAKKIYLDHIRAFTFGKFDEKGNKLKNNRIDFIKDFIEIYESLKNNKFDEKKSLIPVNIKGSIVNGSHRVASSIFLDKHVKIVNLDFENLAYDFNFFYKRNVELKFIEEAVSMFIKFDPNSYLCVLWPSSYKYHKEIEGHIKNVIYKKDLNLTDIGKHNFIIELYKYESWLGSFENQFVGAKNKMVQCFSTNRPLKVIIFQSKNIQEVNLLKNKIREICKIEKHSIHISDNSNFSNIAKIIFNKNSLYFLNRIKYSNLKKEFDFIKKIKFFFKEKKIDINKILITGSYVLSLFGMRKNDDVDYLHSESIDFGNVFILGKKISNHKSQLNLYGTKLDDLIYDNDNFFYFNGIKIICLNELKNFKKNRLEQKDKLDIDLIETYFSKKSLKFNISLSSQKLIYKYYYYRYHLILILIKLKLYKIIKFFYKK